MDPEPNTHVDPTLSDQMERGLKEEGPKGEGTKEEGTKGKHAILFLTYTASCSDIRHPAQPGL